MLAWTYAKFRVMLDVLSQYAHQAFSQTLKTGRPEGMFCQKNYKRLSEFSYIYSKNGRP